MLGMPPRGGARREGRGLHCLAARRIRERMSAAPSPSLMWMRRPLGWGVARRCKLEGFREVRVIAQGAFCAQATRTLCGHVACVWYSSPGAALQELTGFLPELERWACAGILVHGAPARSPSSAGVFGPTLRFLVIPPPWLRKGADDPCAIPHCSQYMIVVLLGCSAACRPGRCIYHALSCRQVRRPTHTWTYSMWHGPCRGILLSASVGRLLWPAPQ